MQTRNNHVLDVLAVFFLFAGLAMLGTVLSGCNTIEGVGKDTEAAGDAIADTARDAKD